MLPRSVKKTSSHDVGWVYCTGLVPCLMDDLTMDLVAEQVGTPRTFEEECKHYQ